MPLPSALGPDCVGLRVVVRRRLRGETGPTGGPRLTDLLGVMEAWDETTTTVRPEHGEPVVIARADIVSGKAVPPRPPVRGRVGVETAGQRIAETWPALHTHRLGDWLLRDSEGFSARGGSALMLGDPGVPWEQAVDAVERFYRERGRPAVAQVPIDSEADRRLTEAGWQPLRAHENEVLTLLGGVAAAARALRDPSGAQPRPAALDEPTLSDDLPDRWAATDPRLAEFPTQARAVLEGVPERAFATLGDPARAKGRVAVVPSTPEWAVLSDLWVDPTLRRTGLGRAVAGALVGWAAERGVSTLALQVVEANRAALELYGALGFAEHHRSRYLTPR